MSNWTVDECVCVVSGCILLIPQLWPLPSCVILQSVACCLDPPVNSSLSRIMEGRGGAGRGTMNAEQGARGQPCVWCARPALYLRKPLLIFDDIYEIVPSLTRVDSSNLNASQSVTAVEKQEFLERLALDEKQTKHNPELCAVIQYGLVWWYGLDRH